MSAPNYPGGFNATAILVFLYWDGRQNFTIHEEETICPWPYDKQDRESIRTCKSFKRVEVAGYDWSQIMKAADAAATELRGCTWEQFKANGSQFPEVRQLSLAI